MKPDEQRLSDAVREAGGPPISEESLHKLGQAAREELTKAPKSQPWQFDAAVLLVLNVVMGLGAAAMVSWSDTQHASATMRNLVAACWLLVMAFGSVLWLRPGSPTARWLVGGGFVVASALAIAGASGFDPATPFFSGIRCTLSECAIAFIPLCVMLAFSTRFAASALHVFMGALAVSAGGALALHFHCANGTVAHIALFHVFPPLLLGALAVAVRRFMRPKTFAP